MQTKVTRLQELNSNADANNPANSAADNAVIKANYNKLAAQIDYNTSLADIEKSRMRKWQRFKSLQKRHSRSRTMLNAFKTCKQGKTTSYH
jgi:uncharacterized membrane protein YgaE (UPF0421/DUF939 family)